MQIYFFWVSYKRRKVLQKYFFLISYQRRKLLQNCFFWFLINPAKCFRIKFLFFSSTMLSSQEPFYLVCYQRRKVLQKYLFFGFLSTPQRASEFFFISDAKICRIVFYGLLSTPKSASEFHFLVSDQRHKVLQNNLILFVVIAARCCRNFFGSLSTPQNYFSLMPQSASEILVFGFSSAPENASELLSLCFLSTLLSS